MIDYLELKTPLHARVAKWSLKNGKAIMKSPEDSDELCYEPRVFNLICRMQTALRSSHLEAAVGSFQINMYLHGVVDKIKKSRENKVLPLINHKLKTEVCDLVLYNILIYLYDSFVIDLFFPNLNAANLS